MSFPYPHRYRSRAASSNEKAPHIFPGRRAPRMLASSHERNFPAKSEDERTACRDHRGPWWARPMAGVRARRGNDRYRRRLLRPQRRAARSETAPHDGLATRGAFLVTAVRRPRSAFHIYPGASVDRKAGRHARGRAPRAERLLRGASDEHAVGSAAACLLQRRGALDVLDDAVPSRRRGRQRRGNGTVARRLGAMARVARLLSGFDRNAQRRPRLLLRRRSQIAPPRLQRQYRRRLRRVATHFGVYHGGRNLVADRSTRVRAVPIDARSPRC